MEEIIQRIILENIENIRNKAVVRRNIPIPTTEDISILSGIRRCGKTYRLYQQIQESETDDFLFLDFEDERLLPLFAMQDYDIILDSYTRIFPEIRPILYFDEIQNLPNWHLYLKRLRNQDYKIYVTGSNANLLSKEIATYLKGRSLETHIYPFSFTEYLKMKEIKFSEKDLIVKLPEMLNAFDDYLYFGGFPQVIKSGEKDKKVVIKTLHDLLLYKDVVAKYDKDAYLIRLIITKLVENVGKAFSLSSLTNKLASIYQSTRTTVTEYVNTLHLPFTIHSLFQYRKSFVKREMERKVYFQDNSFITQNTITFDKSRLLENLVFNHFSRFADEMYYYKTNNNLEVDFLIKHNDKLLPVQVAFSLTDTETKARGIKVLSKCMQELELSSGLILTYQEQSLEKVADEKEITILPVLKYILGF